MTDAIRNLARTCAENNLSLREARALFEMLYIADCVRLSGGNRSKAAEIAGIERAHFYRIGMRHARVGE